MATTVRKFRADDTLWMPAKEKTAAEGITVTDVLCDALERYNAGIGVEQHPDSAVYVVRWRPRPSGPRAKVAAWTYSAPVADVDGRTQVSAADARRAFRQVRKTMANCDVELVRRADYIVEQT